ncbi:MAG: DUF5615 family PIN-like protein [Bacteroidia bacterium]|nr:DUF5615 family PIN-like protein [Bacteroidia bacterium]
MLKFIIDEDLHRSLGTHLQEQGYFVKDIRDYGLRGADDEKIFEFAQKEKVIILSGDKGFGNIIRFPLGRHAGIIIIRFPNEMSTLEINNQFIKRIKYLSENDIHGNVIIIEPGKIRIRRK